MIFYIQSHCFCLFIYVHLFLAIYGTIYIHILITSKKQVQSNYSETNTLYNITKYLLFYSTITIIFCKLSIIYFCSVADRVYLTKEKL